ncbi:putative F-box domain-containing protein [Arabidopsis thaliana]|uniref:F-box domain n=1 Tax=Arabidopsis thaliana x Arabidopsis arenosa TaxID=1240361 RepID=A0A8T2CXD7_9BRAS|nr:F-box domain [Arabidopsis thaliana x Arabidopsis arenosa]
MESRKTFDSIPDDLVVEIALRLSSKSIARCRCVSKLWASILYRQDFTELFITKSSARPRLLFAVLKASGLIFYSSPQSQNPSLEVDFHNHMKFHEDMNLYMCSYVSGTENLKWRKMICPLTHEPYYGRALSINGVLYYFARTSCFLVVSFNVRSEKFKFLDGKDFSNFHREFINYKGKLGVTKLECDAGYGHPRELCVWVLEDVENQEWSQYIYSLPKIKDLSIDDSKQLKSKPQQRRHVKNMQAILLQNKYDLLGNSE